MSISIALQVFLVLLDLTVCLVSPAQQDLQDFQDHLDFKVQWELLDLLDRLDQSAEKDKRELPDFPEPQVSFPSCVPPDILHRLLRYLLDFVAHRLSFLQLSSVVVREGCSVSTTELFGQM